VDIRTTGANIFIRKPVVLADLFTFINDETFPDSKQVTIIHFPPAADLKDT
jgi:hypothetical protein